VEAVKERELEAMVHGEECIVAINNKDIRDQERGHADFDRSLALLESAPRTGTPCPARE
jgi:indole-3-glycerol phosphate synthase